MSLNEIVENDGGRKVDLNVNPNVTTERGQEFYDQHICGSFEDMNLKDKLYENFFSISKCLSINKNVLQPIYISNNKLFD